MIPTCTTWFFIRIITILLLSYHRPRWCHWNDHASKKYCCSSSVQYNVGVFSPYSYISDWWTLNMLDLHREHTIHADLCPENVEFLDAFCISKETKDEETSMPIQKVRCILSSILNTNIIIPLGCPILHQDTPSLLRWHWTTAIYAQPGSVPRSRDSVRFVIAPPFFVFEHTATLTTKS